jgi:hypothetical protein
MKTTKTNKKPVPPMDYAQALLDQVGPIELAEALIKLRDECLFAPKDPGLARIFDAVDQVRAETGQPANPKLAGAQDRTSATPAKVPPQVRQREQAERREAHRLATATKQPDQDAQLARQAEIEREQQKHRELFLKPSIMDKIWDPERRARKAEEARVRKAEVQREQQKHRELFLRPVDRTVRFKVEIPPPIVRHVKLVEVAAPPNEPIEASS